MVFRPMHLVPLIDAIKVSDIGQEGWPLRNTGFLEEVREDCGDQGQVLQPLQVPVSQCMRRRGESGAEGS